MRGLAPGLWHYDSLAHALERLQGVAPNDAALGAPGEAALSDAVAVVVVTAIFGRTGHKYRDRTYRYVLADLGHALENLRVAAGAAGAQARFVAGFDESRAAATLGVDEAEEGCSPWRRCRSGMHLRGHRCRCRAGWRRAGLRSRHRRSA